MKVARHRKISADALASFHVEVEKIMALKTYKELSRESGLTLGSVQQLMAQLIRERRNGVEIVHRGTQLVDVEILASSATLHG